MNSVVDWEVEGELRWTFVGPLALLGLALGACGFLPSTVATPVFSPPGGSYTTTQHVSISTTTSGASIRYTTDQTAPSPTNGVECGEPVEIRSTTTLRAIGYRSAWEDSAEATATYTIVPGAATVATPTFDPPQGTYATAQSVTISTTTLDASVRYTTNGAAPTSSSGTEYTDPLSIATTTTLKAIAYKAGMGDSTVATGVYTISSGDTPSDDVTVYITETGAKYHRAGCQYLAHSCIPILLSEAKAQGYTPCSVCKPPRSVALVEDAEGVAAAVSLGGPWRPRGNDQYRGVG